MNIAIATIGTLVLLLGLLSGELRRAWLSEPIVALGLGVVVGPHVLGWLELSRWGEPLLILEEAARLTLAVGLMGVALRLPRSLFRRQWKALAMMLGPVMLAMWLVSGGLAWAMLPVGAGVALLIGAIVTPTDPVLASAILTGSLAEDNLRSGLRNVISAESGANDGLAYPLVLGTMFAIEAGGSAAGASEVGVHIVKMVVWDVAGGVVLGFAVGWLADWLLHVAERHKSIDATSILAYSLALSLAVLGLAKLVGLNEILAVFAAGCGFSSVATVRDRQVEEHTQEAVNRFFILPIFTLLGIALPWGGWAELGWAGLALAGLVLLLRRLPAVWLMRKWIGPFRSTPAALFAGWFGPIGVAALFYATYASRHLPDHKAAIWPVVSLIIVASTLAHGLTATPFIHLYQRAKRRR